MPQTERGGTSERIRQLRGLDRKIDVVVNQILPHLIGLYVGDIRAYVADVLNGKNPDYPAGWERLGTSEEVGGGMLSADSWATVSADVEAIARIVSGGKSRPKCVHLSLLKDDKHYPGVVLDVGVGDVALGVGGWWRFFNRAGEEIREDWVAGRLAVMGAVKFLAANFSIQHQGLLGVEEELGSWLRARKEAIEGNQLIFFYAAKGLGETVRGLGEPMVVQNGAEQGVILNRRADLELAEAVAQWLRENLGAFLPPLGILIGNQVFVGQNADGDPSVMFMDDQKVRVGIAFAEAGKKLKYVLGADEARPSSAGPRECLLDNTPQIESASRLVEALREFVERARAQEATP